MSDAETKTITLKFDVSVQSWGKRGVRAVLGPFAEEGPQRQCFDRLKTRILEAINSADLGAVVAGPSPEREQAPSPASLEATALAKLLGWSPTFDLTKLQQVARDMVAGSRVSSLRDVAEYVGGVNVLHTVDLAVEALAEGAESEEVYTLAEAEEKIAEGWDDDEPLDQAIATSIKDGDLTKLARTALRDHYTAPFQSLIELVEKWSRRRSWHGELRTKRACKADRRLRERAKSADQWRLAFETLAARSPAAKDDMEVIELRRTVELLKFELRHRCMLPAELVRELDL